MVNVYLFVVVVVLFLGRGMSEECCVYGVSMGTVTMFSSVMQCAIIQMCVLPMYEELEDRSPRRFFTALFSAFAFLAVLFSLFTTAAYFVFGPNVHANVIADFPGDLRGTLARMGLTVAVLTVYPVIMTSVVAPIRHWEESQATGSPDAAPSRKFSQLATVAIVAASGIGAAFFDQLGTLNQINGALQVVCFIGLVPGSAGLFLMDVNSKLWRLSMWILVLVSILASLLGFVYTKNTPEALASVCRWSTGS